MSPRRQLRHCRGQLGTTRRPLSRRGHALLRPAAASERWICRRVRLGTWQILGEECAWADLRVPAFYSDRELVSGDCQGAGAVTEADCALRLFARAAPRAGKRLPGALYAPALRRVYPDRD